MYRMGVLAVLTSKLRKGEIDFQLLSHIVNHPSFISGLTICHIHEVGVALHFTRCDVDPRIIRHRRFNDNGISQPSP
jgi:hypothetical protein